MKESKKKESPGLTGVDSVGVSLMRAASSLASDFVLFGRNYHNSQQKDRTWNEPRKFPHEAQDS